ncbi:MAG TPA: hypothetical protein PK728_08795 [Bacillota bacterium]|nr:hypothetical protein [Bacillota bacterium]
MSQKIFYAPILKWKTGEKTALQALHQIQKKRITPILELTDYQEPSKVIGDLCNCYEYAVYVDTIYVDEGDRQYLTSLIEESKNRNQTIHPVLYFEDLPDLANKISPNRIVVRVPVPEDIDGPDYQTIFDYLDEWSKNNSINLDIMLDLNVIDTKQRANLLYMEVKNVLKTYIINNHTWQRIIIAMTSFPEDLSSIPAGESRFFERLDIKIFEKLYKEQSLSTLKSRLVFSDYGVTKFTDTDIDFSKLRHGILPKAKYTTSHQYWVLKGEKNHLTKTWIKDHKAIAQEICNSKYYYGEDFSFGDLEIRERAYGLNNKGPGNNTNWVAIDANHHISVVIEELSKIFDS